MKLLHIVSSLAVASALAISTPVFAQNNMIGDWAIPADQTSNFQERCEALRAAATTPETSGSGELSDDATDNTQTGTVATTGTGDTNTSPDPAAVENVETMLAGLNVEQCDAAGL